MSDLPHGWACANLEELTGIDGLATDGDWIESKDQDPEGGVRLIQLADVGDGNFRDRSSRFVTDLTAERLRCTYLKQGDLLIARMPDPLGRACIFPSLSSPAITAVDVFVWRRGAKTATFTEWVMHSINSPIVRANIIDQAGGTTRQRIAGGRLKQLSLRLPPLPEQRRIVAKIDSLTCKSRRARDHLDHIPRLVEKYKQAILAAAFRGDLTRDVTDHNCSLLSDNEINSRTHHLDKLPLGWTWSSIKTVGHVSGGLTKNSSRSSLPQQVPYLRVANVYANELRLVDIAYIGCTDGELQRTMLKAGDLLLVEGNGSIEQIGRVAICNCEIPECSHQNHIIRVIYGSLVKTDLALYWLISPLSRNNIETVSSSGSGLHTLSLSKVGNLPIPLCSRDEQTSVILRIKSAFAWIDRLAADATSARKLIDHLDQAVLAKAFRGELVPQDPNDEPASVLLDRIRAEREAAPKARRGRKKTA